MIIYELLENKGALKNWHVKRFFFWNHQLFHFSNFPNYSLTCDFSDSLLYRLSVRMAQTETDIWAKIFCIAKNACEVPNEKPTHWFGGEPCLRCSTSHQSTVIYYGAIWSFFSEVLSKCVWTEMNFARQLAPLGNSKIHRWSVSVSVMKSFSDPS